MTKLSRWLAACGLWLLYGGMVGIVVATCSPKFSTGFFAVTASLLFAVLISILFKLK